MLAQAEHDVDASAILLTTSKRLAQAVAQEIERQLATLPTAHVARKSIAKNSAIILVESLDEAVEMSNRFAPEHLSIPDASLLAGIRHAGSVFIGAAQPRSGGRLRVSGPNHVLPTSGAARLRGGLSAADYVKVISMQEVSAELCERLAPAITTLARAEGLEAHARSVEVRCAGRRMAKRIRPREAVLQMAPYSSAHRRTRRQTAPGLQREYRRLLAEVIEFLKQRLDENRLAVYPEYVEAKRDLAALLQGQPRARCCSPTAPTKRSRS